MSGDRERQTGKEWELESVYGQVFLDIERLAAETDGSLSPQQAYELYEAHLAVNDLDPTIYLSMAITSGGFARDADMPIGEVIGKNSQYGTMAREALLRQHPELSEKHIILPSDLGKVKGWSQSDYLLFWFHTITGLTAEHAQGVSEAMQPSLTYPGFTDKTLGTDERWRDYERFTDDYVHCLQDLAARYGRKLQPNNIQAMIMILDGEMSLGGRAEERLCRSIGIPPQFQYIDTSTLHETTGLNDTIDTLRGMGAKALGMSLNPAGFKYYGVSLGATNPNLAFNLGLRKTGLSNATLTEDYYRKNPTARPPRHAGHTPIRADALPGSRGPRAYQSTLF